MIELTRQNIRIFSLLGAQRTFGYVASSLLEKSDKVMIITADQGSVVGLESVKKQYPDKFLNIGIAEQNMIGIAGGLAKEGFVPVVCAQATFATGRCYDQIKDSLGYMGFNVKVVGLSSGLTLGSFGATHMSLEDISLMRSLPNMVILSPADGLSAVKCLFAAIQSNKPAYIRLSGQINMPIVYKEDFEFEIGKAIWLREGEDVCIIATGSMVYQSLKAAEKLEAEGLKTGVVDMHTIKPLDVQAIEKACQAKLIVTIEEHSKFGGLGSAVAETLAIKSKRPAQVMIGTEDYYAHAGDYEYLLEEYGLTAPQIVAKIVETYKNLRGGGRGS